MRIFITGATGFLGSNLVESLTQYGFKLLCLKRSFSNIRKFKSRRNIQWVDMDDESDWKGKVRMFNPEIVIHAAWIGVSVEERADELMQISNIRLIKDILDVSRDARKFIGFGSQDEYGYIDGVVDENMPLHPMTPYGKIKMRCSEIVRSFCVERGISWYWMRIFSVYGRGNRNSVIQQVVEKMATDTTMNVTLGEQQYAFLHISDFCRAVYSVVIHEEADSGIYNISSRMRDLFFQIRRIYNPKFTFRFGAMPYRPNQPMLLLGNSSKFIERFGPFERVDLSYGLEQYMIND